MPGGDDCGHHPRLWTATGALDAGVLPDRGAQRRPRTLQARRQGDAAVLAGRDAAAEHLAQRRPVLLTEGLDVARRRTGPPEEGRPDVVEAREDRGHDDLPDGHVLEICGGAQLVRRLRPAQREAHALVARPARPAASRTRGPRGGSSGPRSARTGQLSAQGPGGVPVPVTAGSSRRASPPSLGPAPTARQRAQTSELLTFLTARRSRCDDQGRAPVAQRIEQVPSKHLVAGSIPAGRATGPRPATASAKPGTEVWHSAQRTDDSRLVWNTWESLIRDFVRHLKGTNRAVNTQMIYRRAALGLVAFLERNGELPVPRQLTRRHVEA